MDLVQDLKSLDNAFTFSIYLNPTKRVHAFLDFCVTLLKFFTFFSKLNKTCFISFIILFTKSSNVSFAEKFAGDIETCSNTNASRSIEGNP